MDFFDIGPLELLFILVIALIVFGPEKLVSISKSLGRTVHSFRKAASDLTTQVNREIEEAKDAVKLPDGKEGKPPDPPRPAGQ